jgi:hypothetical protein
LVENLYRLNREKDGHAYHYTGSVSMNRQRFSQQARPVLYLIAGVLPALCLALFSLFFLMAGLRGAVLSLAAWLGCLGLILATLQPPKASTSGRLQLTCLLLLIGILAITPLLPPVTTAPLQILSLSALIGGPPLVALHYLYCALPLLGRQQWRNAGIAVALASLCFAPYWLRSKPPTQMTYSTAQTSEVSLVVDGELQERGPIMGLHYLRKLPYQAIHYQGRIYKPLHRDAWASTPAHEQSVRYLVHEEVNSNPGSKDWPERIEWAVYDQNSGTLMARRELWRKSTRTWSRDTPRGWQGDNARLFIAGVLVPTPGARPAPSYPKALFHSEQQAVSSPRDLTELETQTNGCNGDIELARDASRRQYVESRSAGWRFENNTLIRQVFCSGDSIYILSAILPGELKIDQLDHEGHGQAHFSVQPWPRAIHEGIRHQYVSELRHDSDGISLRIDFLRDWASAGQDAEVGRTLKLVIEPPP